MRILLVLVALVLAPNAFAKTITCSGCGVLAKRSLAINAGIGIHFVVDMNDGSIAKWKVEKDCAGSNCIIATTSMTVDQSVINYVAFYRVNNGKIMLFGDHPTFPDSAYEAVRFPQLSANVGAHIKDVGAGLTQDYLNFMAGVGGIVGFSVSPIQLTVRVVYEDGSTSLNVYNHVTQTWDRVKGESRDSSNNLIPETAATVTGGPGTTVTYSFTGNPNNLIDFVYQLTLLGVPITGPTSNRNTIVCVSDSQSTVCRSGN